MAGWGGPRRLHGEPGAWEGWWVTAASCLCLYLGAPACSFSPQQSHPATQLQGCQINFGGVRTENATALLLAAAFTAADGFFANATASALVADSCEACNTRNEVPPPLSCNQQRSALRQAAQLAERYGWGTAEQVRLESLSGWLGGHRLVGW